MSQSYRTAPCAPGRYQTAGSPAPYPDRVLPGTTERRFLSLADSAERVPSVTARRARHRPAARGGVESGRGW